MLTLKGLTISAAALVMLGGCTSMRTTEAGATETAIFDAWEDSLPSRSHKDTAKTQKEIGRAYDVFEAVSQRKVDGI